jgi:hypothetical protein
MRLDSLAYNLGKKPVQPMPAKKTANADETKKPHGRPTLYTPELADEICERLSKGEPLAVICRDDHMPAVRTVSDWKEKHEGFSADFARARNEGYDFLASQCMEIADDERFDWKLTQKGLITNETVIGRARLQVETRLKLLAKWDPKRYGDKQEVTHAVTEETAAILQRIRERRES